MGRTREFLGTVLPRGLEAGTAPHNRERSVHMTVAAVIAAFSAALTLLPSPVLAETSAQPCEVGRPLVDVTILFANDQDVDSNGDVWAIDTGVTRFRLYRTGGDTFCAAITDAGTFTTFGGPSPAGTGTVPAGHRGRFAGTSTVRFGGTFAPTLPTRGFVGTFDRQCDQYQCQSPRIGFYYLEIEGPPMADTYRYVYVSSCGVWIVTSAGDRGDIAC